MQSASLGILMHQIIHSTHNANRKQLVTKQSQAFIMFLVFELCDCVATERRPATPNLQKVGLFGPLWKQPKLPVYWKEIFGYNLKNFSCELD